MYPWSIFPIFNLFLASKRSSWWQFLVQKLGLVLWLCRLKRKQYFVNLHSRIGFFSLLRERERLIFSSTFSSYFSFDTCYVRELGLVGEKQKQQQLHSPANLLLNKEGRSSFLYDPNEWMNEVGPMMYFHLKVRIKQRKRHFRRLM